MTRSFVSRAAALVALPALAAVSGCRGEVSEEPPVVLIRNMFNQPRYQAQGQGAFFADGRAMRPAVEGTVSRDSFVADEERATGRTRDGLDYVAEGPAGVADAFGGKEPMLARGRERFGIYCAPCHGLVGDGTGTVALRSKLSPNAGGARGFSGVASHPSGDGSEKTPPVPTGGWL